MKEITYHYQHMETMIFATQISIMVGDENESFSRSAWSRICVSHIIAGADYLKLFFQLLLKYETCTSRQEILDAAF